MDAKQLTEQGRTLVKAFDSGEPASSLLTLLAPLEKLSATEELLRSSKIGVAVARLRTSKDPQVASKASQLVNKWKAAVGKKKATGNSSPSPAVGAKPGASNGVAQNGRSSTGSPAPAKKGAAPAKTFTAAPEKRTVKEDGISVNVTGNSTRDGCMTLIYNGLCFMSEESPQDILSVAQRVEAAAYDAFKPETSAAYKTKMRVLFMNMKMKENAWLRKDVFSGVIDAQKLVHMSSEELKSEERAKADKQMEKENMNNAMTAVEEKAISTTMTCGKCKQSRVAYSQAQTRSADEPLTTFCECTVCGHRWKFS